MAKKQAGAKKDKGVSANASSKSKKDKGVSANASSKSKKDKGVSANASSKKKAEVEGHRGLEPNLVKALAHPLRAQLLAIFNERVTSPNRLSVRLGQKLGNISYHVRVLEKYNCIELVKTEPRRGATEHFYRGITRSFLNEENWSRLNPSERAGISIAGLKMIFNAAQIAVAGDTFDKRDDRHLSCTPVKLDEQGWAELVPLLATALEGVMTIQAKATARLAEAMSDEQVVKAVVSILNFTMPPDYDKEESLVGPRS